MSLEEALSVLRTGAKTNSVAVVAWAFKLTHENPANAPYVAVILAAVFAN